jgi:hypothetical protein
MFDFYLACLFQDVKERIRLPGWTFAVNWFIFGNPYQVRADTNKIQDVLYTYGLDFSYKRVKILELNPDVLNKKIQASGVDPRYLGLIK